MNFSGNTVTHKNRHIETTEWEDVLVNHGIISERKELVEERKAKAEAKQRAEVQVKEEDYLGNKSLEELDVLEDEYEEELMRRMRDQRLQELEKKVKGEKFGEVYPISKADFVREVSEASKDGWVVVEMFKDGIQESTKASELLRILAGRQKACKFVRIRSTDCVENWPDSSVPCFFLYKEGVMQKQLVGLGFCGGPERATAESMELAFAIHGLFEVDLSEVEEAIAEKLGVGGTEDKEVRPKTSGVGNKVADLPNERTVSSKGSKLANLEEDDDDW